jgi:autotransporter translocation and assembly factor TamB
MIEEEDAVVDLDLVQRIDLSAEQGHDLHRKGSIFFSLDYLLFYEVIASI